MQPYAPDPEANVGIENAYTTMVEAALDPTKEGLRPDLHALIITHFGQMDWGQREALFMHPYWEQILSSAAYSPDGVDGLKLDQRGHDAYRAVARIVEEHTEDPQLDALMRFLHGRQKDVLGEEMGPPY